MSWKTSENIIERMTSVTPGKEKDYSVRARLPLYFRSAAVFLVGVIVVVIAIAFYRNTGSAEFRMKSLPASLSKDVVATVDAYERKEVDGDILRYYVKADKATTFSDQHQELEGVLIEVFNATGIGSEKITSQKAIYIPGDNKDFTAFFAGDVAIETRDALKVNTEQLKYERAAETATAEEFVKFERGGIKGTSIGASVNAGAKSITLAKDVSIEINADPADVAHNSATKIKTGSAIYDQVSETIKMNGGVNIVSTEQSAAGRKTVEITSADGVVRLTKIEASTHDLLSAELFRDVGITVVETGSQTTKISSGYAKYDRLPDRFDLSENVNIVTAEGEQPTTIRANNAVYERTAGKLALNGGAEIVQGAEIVKGETINALLSKSGSLKSAVVRQNAYLKQTQPERILEISGNEVNAEFEANGQIKNASSVGGSTVKMSPTTAGQFTLLTLSAQRSIKAFFKSAGSLGEILTEGRTTIVLTAPNNGVDSADKKVVADTVKTEFAADGKNMKTASAVGSAELIVTPHTAGERNYLTTINAPRFDCEFFPTGNNVRSCIASVSARAVRKPTVARPGVGDQIITADSLAAAFDQGSNDVSSMTAIGKAKFSELDRTASSGRFEYSASDGMLRLRGNDPTAWDSRARGKAKEIDWDTKNQRSELRGGVSTTYYSQTQTRGATPFSQSGKPVFITAANASIDHRSEVAVYKGNARAWQDDNYVRANTLTIKQVEGELFGEGAVQSLLYDTKPSADAKAAKSPVYVASDRIIYKRDGRLLRYESNVDIRQGSDRITGAIANIFLDESNEITRTDLEGSVIINQPGRKATGDFAQYIAADDKFVIRGNPARIDDAKAGATQGTEVTMFVKDNRVIGVGGSQRNPSGRLRSVYKVKTN